MPYSYDYRCMIVRVFGPILEYIGLTISDEWVIQTADGSAAIRLHNKYVFAAIIYCFEEKGLLGISGCNQDPSD